jgi:DNA-binding NarL/FixJ family response regulator
MDGFERLAGGGAGLHPGRSADGPGRRRLAVVDRSRLRRDCLKLALGLQAKRWRVADAAEAKEVARLIEQGVSFAVILLGGSTCSQISFRELELLLAAAPGTPILVAADCDDRDRALALLSAGARGFVPTNLGLKVLVAALERVRAGATYVPLQLAEPVADEDPELRMTSSFGLTHRQNEVIALIAEGLSNRLIATTLTITESTVKAHVKEIIKRLNVVNRTQAALLAVRSRSAAKAPVAVRVGALGGAAGGAPGGAVVRELL